VVSVGLLAVGYTAAVALFESALNFGPTTAAVSPWWLLAPAAALLVLQLPFRNRWGGRVAHRAFALAVAAGTPATAPTSGAKLSPKETVS
jgi:NAD(P)H-quinone oxidoreductase subunit 5